MDPETRKVHATMLVIRRTALIAVSTFLTFYIFYAVLGSGYDCEAEAKLVQEWPFQNYRVEERKRETLSALTSENLTFSFRCTVLDKKALSGGSRVCWLYDAR